jgi:hypothetical protein
MSRSSKTLQRGAFFPCELDLAAAAEVSDSTVTSSARFSSSASMRACTVTSRRHGDNRRHT